MEILWKMQYMSDLTDDVGSEYENGIDNISESEGDIDDVLNRKEIIVEKITERKSSSAKENVPEKLMRKDYVERKAMKPIITNVRFDSMIGIIVKDAMTLLFL